jgi:hypothetical protein
MNSIDKTTLKRVFLEGMIRLGKSMSFNGEYVGGDE